MKQTDFAGPFRIAKAKNFRLRDFDPGETLRLKSKEDAQETLDRGLSRLEELQEKLYAQDRWALLVILQGMDAAGKDSTIKHVMSGVNPQGCRVESFKQPSAEELRHDFLWRSHLQMPPRGFIGIFNRSYYEEVLVVRVHPEALAGEKLPANAVSSDLWQQRFEDINAHERYLSRNGIRILKFFLHLSKGEQKKRFLKRVEEPAKNWKFSESDVLERNYWKQYMSAYEDAIRNTSTEWAPWYAVPADHKWFSRLVVAEAIIGALEQLHPAFPKVDAAARKELKRARTALEKEE